MGSPITEHPSTMFSGHVGTTAPTDSDNPNRAVAVGDLWVDTTASAFKRCSSISPITFVTTEYSDAGAIAAVEGEATLVLTGAVTNSGSLAPPQGAGGATGDAAGEMCVDTTSKTLNFHDGGAERVLNPVKHFSIVVADPVATDDFPAHRMDVAGTIQKITYLCISGTNWIGQVQEGDSNGINGVDTAAADTTATATVTLVDTFTNAAYDAGDYLILKTTSISGTPTWLVVTVYYVENP